MAQWTRLVLAVVFLATANIGSAEHDVIPALQEHAEGNGVERTKKLEKIREFLKALKDGEETIFAGKRKVTRRKDGEFMLCEGDDACFPNLSQADIERKLLNAKDGDDEGGLLGVQGSLNPPKAPSVNPSKPASSNMKKPASVNPEKTAQTGGASATASVSGHTEPVLVDLKDGAHYKKTLDNEKNKYVVMTYGDDNYCQTCRFLHGHPKAGETNNVPDSETLGGLAKTYKGKVSFYSMDITHPHFRGYYDTLGVTQIPATVVFERAADGKLTVLSKATLIGSGVAAELKKVLPK